MQRKRSYPRSHEPKRCARCGDIKPAAEFDSDPRLRSGLRSKCKECRAAEWQAGNGHRPGYHRDYAAANPEKIRAKERRRDRGEYNRTVYQQSRDQQIAKARQWQRDNPERKCVTQANYRTRATGAGGEYTIEEWLALVEQYEGRCLRCGRADRPLQGDHVIPVSKGGTGDIGNIQPLCGPCNSAKGARTIDYRPAHATVQ